MIDADGKESDYIDVIIYDRQFTPPVFNTLYIPAESVYAVIEAKQVLNRENVIYAGKKAASIRRLRRTAAEIVDARGKVEKGKVKKPFRITAGIVAYKSSWDEPFGKSLRGALGALTKNQEIDFRDLSRRWLLRSRLLGPQADGQRVHENTRARCISDSVARAFPNTRHRLGDRL